MSAFDLADAALAAEARLPRSRRRSRADRGTSRFPRAIERELGRLLCTQERPSLSRVSRELAAYCRARGLNAPARATLYNALERVTLPTYAFGELPAAVREALYNWQSDVASPSERQPASSASDARRVPGDHLVFYAFNYGSLRAASFASGLPWLCLWRALQKRGWRPKSRALLVAVAESRKL